MALFILIAVVILVVVGILLVKDCTRARESYCLHGEQLSSKNVITEKLREQMALAQRGDARAQYLVAILYLTPDSVMNNLKEGLKWLRLSANQGCCDAQYMLWSYLKSHYPSEAEKEEATGWMLMAAKQGHPKAVELIKKLDRQLGSDLLGMVTGGISYEGGNGLSLENAVVILGADNSWDGIKAEGDWIESQYGNYLKQKQALLCVNGKYYDKIMIELVSGQKLDIYFDITDFYGKH